MTPLVGLFGRSEPPRSSRGIIVVHRSPGSGPRSSRSAVPPAGNTAVLAVEASARRISARHGDHLEGISRRPLTSCAHRLRKPNRTSNASDALCRTTSPRVTGSVLPRLLGPFRVSEGLAVRTLSRRHDPASGTRRTRLAAPAAGLERRPPHEPERLPSVRPEALASSGDVTFVDHSRSITSHPVTRPEPIPPRQRLECRCEVSLRLAESRVTPRLDQHRERCVSPTSATESRHEHPARCPIPVLACDDHRSWLAPFPVSDTCKSRVKLRLTANLQLPLCRNPLTVRSGSRPRSRLLRTPRGPGGASIDRSSAPCFPSATYSIAFEHAAPLLTSSVALAASLALRSLSVPSGALRVDGQAPCSTTTSSKATAPPEPGRLPSTSAPSSASAFPRGSACASPG